MNPGSSLPPRIGKRQLTAAEHMALHELDKLENSLANIYDKWRQMAAQAGDVEAMRWCELARESFERGCLFFERAIKRPGSGLGRSAIMRQAAQASYQASQNIPADVERNTPQEEKVEQGPEPDPEAERLRRKEAFTRAVEEKINALDNRTETKLNQEIKRDGEHVDGSKGFGPV